VWDVDFPVDKGGRKFNKAFHNKLLTNGEGVCRKWLIYSKHKNRGYCYNCYMFPYQSSTSALSNKGICDWKPLGRRLKGSLGSLVSMVFDYGVRSTTEAENFFSNPCVQTGSGAHPTSYPVVTGPFTGGKVQPGRDADLYPHLVPRSRMSRRYTSSPPKFLGV
jgi:hypothetical protein